MPTGYTADIKNGITFEQFVLGCARAFGACVSLRDEPSSTPIPDEFKPNEYYIAEIAKAKTRLTKLKSLTAKEIHREAEKDYQKQLKSHVNMLANKYDLLGKYKAMLEQVKAWQPPTPEHQGLKDFMIQQISTSIEHDCDMVWIKSLKPKKLADADWISKQIEHEVANLEYHTKENKEEIERAKGRTAWVKALRDSLK